MKFSTILPFIGLAAAQTPALYTEPKSGISFNTYINSANGYLFGIALPENATTNTDFIATIGGRGQGWSGVSLGGSMIDKLLIAAWPNNQALLSSFRTTPRYASPAVTSGTFTMTPIANGTYVNSTHWSYTFLCSQCIRSDGSTFRTTDTAASLGWAVSSSAPSSRSNPATGFSKHSDEGQVQFDLTKAKNANFATWKSWAAPKAAVNFAA